MSFFKQVGILLPIGLTMTGVAGLQEEGIVVKAAESAWKMNDRSNSWLKIKPDYATVCSPGSSGSAVMHCSPPLPRLMVNSALPSYLPTASVQAPTQENPGELAKAPGLADVTTPSCQRERLTGLLWRRARAWTSTR